MHCSRRPDRAGNHAAHRQPGAVSKYGGLRHAHVRTAWRDHSLRVGQNPLESKARQALKYLNFSTRFCVLTLCTRIKTLTHSDLIENSPRVPEIGRSISFRKRSDLKERRPEEKSAPARSISSWPAFGV